MPRIRSLRPEFFSDARMAELDHTTRLFYLALWTWADDEGRGRALPKELAGYAFPRDDDVDSVRAHCMLTELSRQGRIVLYEVDGEPYFAIVRWGVHQRPNRPTPSRIPPPPPPEQRRSDHDSLSAHGAVTEPSVSPQRENGVVVRNLELGIRNQEVGTSKATSTAVDTRDPPDGFEAFWKAYPPRNGKKLEKAKAAAQWQRLKPGEKAAALAGAKHYAQACNAGATIAKDAFRWLRDRAYFDWQTPATTNGRSGEPTPDDWRRLADEYERHGK